MLPFYLHFSYPLLIQFLHKRNSKSTHKVKDCKKQNRERKVNKKKIYGTGKGTKRTATLLYSTVGIRKVKES